MDPNADDHKLIAQMVAYQNGSMDDFAGLYETLRRPLLRYLWTFVHDTAVAEDLLQETFLQVHRARHTYTPPRPVRPWIYAITRHVALMYLRAGRRRKESLAAEDLPEIPVPPEIENLADRATAERLLAEIPREGQEVVILHHLLGLSFEEVGQVVGVAAGTAKVRAHRALKALRAKLANGRTVA